MEEKGFRNSKVIIDQDRSRGGDCDSRVDRFQYAISQTMVIRLGGSLFDHAAGRCLHCAVHPALCISFDEACLQRELIGGRSRQRCLGTERPPLPCRIARHERIQCSLIRYRPELSYS
jgi:hypothetical protein